MLGILCRQAHWGAGFGRLLLLCSGLATCGCGKGVGDVSGRVHYKGTTVVYGTVVLAGSDGIPHRGDIQEDGTFAVFDVPAETVRVGVLSPNPTSSLATAKKLPQELRPEMLEKRGMILQTGTARKPKGWIPLPKQYENPNSSGLTMQVTKGQNTQDIELK
jgi:hypothetical protein